MKAVSQKNCEVTSAGNGLVRVLLLEESLADSQDILEELRAAGMNIEPTVLATRQEFVDAITSQNFSAVRKALGETQLRALNDEVQRALQKSEERNRQLVENSVYGVFRILPDGKFVFANPSLLEILACATLEVLQTLNFTTDIFRFPEHCAKLMNSCRKDGLVHNAETEWRRKDGGLLSVKLHLRYLSVPGQADQIEGIVEDVTELRSLEHQLLQAQKFETIGQLASAVLTISTMWLAPFWDGRNWDTRRVWHSPEWRNDLRASGNKWIARRVGRGNCWHLRGVRNRSRSPWI